MSDQESSELKEYVGYIWIGDEPGMRISVWARSADDAIRIVEEKYGQGHPFSIRNIDDAERPR